MSVFLEKVFWAITVMVLSDLQRHGEGALSDNCHCVIRFGATWRRCFQ